MYAMDSRIDQDDNVPCSDTEPNKRKRKKSMVWDHFTIETVNAACVRACCNQCKRSFAYISGSKSAGTSHLKRHILLGTCPATRASKEKSQRSSPYTPEPKSNLAIANGVSLPTKRVRVNNGAINDYIRGENWGYLLAKMIIQHDYPLHIVEHAGFINFMRSLQPQFNVTSVTGVKEQIMGIYYREKQKMQDLFGETLGNINLTLNLWTSNQSLVYVHLTGHFVDNDWKLQRRTFNVVAVHFPDSDTPFNRVVADCLTEWRSKDKLFTLTLDRSFGNEIGGDGLRNLLSIKNPLVLNGQLIIKRCFARTLRSLAHSALGSLRETVDKVRQSVKHIKISAAREIIFDRLKRKLQVPSTKGLMMDDLNKWNTTYLMLVAACELKEVLCCLDTEDPDYVLNISIEEWTQLKILCRFLEIFYEAANVLTSPVYPTANIVFHEVWKVHHELIHAIMDQDIFINSLTMPLLQQFTKYWEDCNLVLAVAVAMDPRFKMQLVEFCFARIYGDQCQTWVKIVDSGMHELYDEYVVQSLPQPTFIEEENDPLVKVEIPHEDPLLLNCEVFSDYDVYLSDITDGEHTSELDQYLEEPVLPRVHDFDVLGWWRVNSSKYPTLSKLACDVLSIPLSTVDPDLVFDIREKKLDNYLNSLRPTMVQALVCAKDWLRYDSLETGDSATEIVKPDC